MIRWRVGSISLRWRRWRGHVFRTQGLAWSHDGRTLASCAGWDSAIHLWDPETGKERLQTTGHIGPVDQLSFRADGRRLFSFGRDSKLIGWYLGIGEKRGHCRDRQWSATPHRIPAIQALVARPAPHGDAPADVARRGVRLEVGALLAERVGDDGQPKLRPATWVVTELKLLRRFVWQARSPGLLMVAEHIIEEASAGTSRVTLRFSFSGLFGALIGSFFGFITESYLAQEVASLKSKVEAAK